MKKMLFLTFVFISVPSFFMLTYKEPKTIEIMKEEANEVAIGDFSINDLYNSNDGNHKLYNEDKSITIKVYQTNKNKITEVDLEDYVRGVLAGEMPVSFNIEALKAQAIAARTYGVKRVSKNNKYDVVDTVMNQVYLDDDTLKIKWGTKYDTYMNKIKEAVSATNGEYVDYNGTYADTLFFSTSVGNTENSEEIFGNKIAYLRSVSSEWDEEVSPVYEEKNTFTREAFCNKLGLSDCSKIYFTITNETSTGRVKNITINNKNFTGSQVAYYLGVRSNYFTIYIENNMVVVATKGFGHGVGMSQYGAQGMANNGYSYREILAHYYQGTTIKNLYV